MYLSDPDAHAGFELGDVGVELLELLGGSVVAPGKVVKAFAFAHGGIEGFARGAGRSNLFGDDAFVSFVNKAFAFGGLSDAEVGFVEVEFAGTEGVVGEIEYPLGVEGFVLEMTWPAATTCMGLTLILERWP